MNLFTWRVVLGTFAGLFVLVLGLWLHPPTTIAETHTVGWAAISCAALVVWLTDPKSVTEQQ